jgi:hypothetical protein
MANIEYRINDLDQQLDIRGSLNQNDAMNLGDEVSLLGGPVSSGSNASVVLNGGNVFISGVGNVNEGNFLQITFAQAPNLGIFLIESVSNGSAQINNPNAVPDVNDGYIIWIERQPYCLEDDLNYARTDRSAIKGTHYYNGVPTYIRPDATGTNVSANLANIAGKTTDAKSIVIDQRYTNISISAGQSYFILSSAGNLKWADSVNTLGIPIFDGYDAGNYNATFVEITDSYNREIVLDGYRIFGIAYGGLGSSPNSFEVEIMGVLPGQNISTGTPFTWITGAPTVINGYYPCRVRSDQVSDSALRSVLINGSTKSVQQNIYAHLFIFRGI